MMLKRLRQCKACPWKVGTDPARDIPGYDRAMHAGLANTIADAMAPPSFDGPLHLMHCHEHDTEEGVPCLGWLMNQLEEGNNIRLRFEMLGCGNLDRVRLDGPQHQTFADTLPCEGT